jgi:hypothetical protein
MKHIVYDIQKLIFEIFLQNSPSQFEIKYLGKISIMDSKIIIRKKNLFVLPI